MAILKPLDDLVALREDVDFEAKSAQGHGGERNVPGSFWGTYSAMANADGGVVLLGVREREDRSLEILGLPDAARVRKILWDNLNNRQIISANLLRDGDVQEIEFEGNEGRRLIEVHVPRAPRQQRPVYVGSNPMTGTYRRGGEGDYHCSEAEVRRMIAEAAEESRDARLLPHFALGDLDAGSLAAYRNEFRSTRPGHPWLTLDDRELLQMLGGWSRDRETGAEGLTLAGVLMFGQLRSILDAVPNYVVDYQEREKSAGAEVRWTDRVTTDGTWSGNLYDFFRRIYQRLTRDIGVPFRLVEGFKRIDESHVHEALRESLVNTLIHADYGGSVGILAVKEPHCFLFRNPGGLRLPLRVILQGGTSDCRNRTLQKMFQLVGAGEQAGSGFPKILRAWKEQSWRAPLLREEVNPEQTILRLPMASLLPQDALDELDQRFGAVFRALSEIERLAVATALIEGVITNERLHEITDTHPRDLTWTLRGLVDRKFLERGGVGRGAYYFVPGDRPGSQDPSGQLSFPDLLAEPPEAESEGSQHLAGGSQHLDGSSQHLDGSSQHLGESSQHLGESSQHLDGGPQHLAGGSQHLEAERLASQVKAKGKVSRAVMEQAILSLCQGRFLTLSQLAGRLGRSPDTLQVHYLSRMVRGGDLELRYPSKPSHPDQAYRAKGAQ